MGIFQKILRHFHDDGDSRFDITTKQGAAIGGAVGLAAPLIGAIHLGTPLLFDVGVYLVVIGFVLVVAGGLDPRD